MKGKRRCLVYAALFLCLLIACMRMENANHKEKKSFGDDFYSAHRQQQFSSCFDIVEEACTDNVRFKLRSVILCQNNVFFYCLFHIYSIVSPIGVKHSKNRASIIQFIHEQDGKKKPDIFLCIL